MVTETREGICPICDRFHDDSEPCPMRIARAYTEATVENLEALTSADRDWMGKHKGFNVTLELEVIIANMMP